MIDGGPAGPPGGADAGLSPETASPAAETAAGRASTDDPAIRTRGLTRRYGTIVALDHLDMTVPSGSIFGLLGPNGAGKTTTIRLLTGLAHPTSGDATVVGVPVGGDETELHRRIGYLDQEPRYYGWMRGRELLQLAGSLHGMTGAALRARVDEVLELVGLVGAGSRRIATYSGGMRQRLGIGQALINRPALLILDEPMSSLDPEGRRDMIELIRSMRGQATVLLSTHILNDVERACDRVAILNQGRLLIELSIEELLTEHARPVYRLEAERGQPDLEALATALQAAPWTRAVTRNREELRVAVEDPAAAAREILPLVVQYGVTLLAFERLRPSLEDVFLQMVGSSAAPARASAPTGPAGPAAASGTRDAGR